MGGFGSRGDMVPEAASQTSIVHVHVYTTITITPSVLYLSMPDTINQDRCFTEHVESPRYDLMKASFLDLNLGWSRTNTSML